MSATTDPTNPHNLKAYAGCVGQREAEWKASPLSQAGRPRMMGASVGVLCCTMADFGVAPVIFESTTAKPEEK